MCGIAGFTWRDHVLLEGMVGTLAHRGPDQSGTWSDGQVSLGHRRLSVIDLSERGRQPMAVADGAVQVVFNGEIYNFRALRWELEALGHAFRSATDTEVIGAAYLQWGPACVEHLDGMFAFAIWDQRDRTLTVARDRIGIKPLYYCLPEGPGPDLIFASELKALLTSPRVPRTMDAEALYQYLGFEFVPAPRTIFAGVHKLPPGHMLRWKRGRAPVVQRYWRLQVAAVERTRGEHEELLREKLEAAVRSHLMADVPLGVLLSGGLDSSAIVAMMSRLGVAPLDTFSLHYEDASFSELEYAEHVARTFGTRHHVLRIDPVTPDMIATCCWHLDEPMTDLSALPFYLLCREVRQHVTVCLSGEGGDELLCGYDRFRAARLHRFYRAVPKPVRRHVLGPLVGRLSDRPQKKGAVNVLKRFVEGDMLPAEGRHMRWQYFSSPRLERHLFNDHARAHMSLDPFAPVRDVLVGAECQDAVAEQVYVDTVMTMPDSLLMKADKLSMAHGLEVRVPLLDRAFAEFCCTIPSGLKLEGGTTKSIFRSALRGILPDRIVSRGKQGYSLPVKTWLRTELRDYMQDTFAASSVIDEFFDRRFLGTLVKEHLDAKANHNHVLWALLNLAVWHDLFIVA